METLVLEEHRNTLLLSHLGCLILMLILPSLIVPQKLYFVKILDILDCFCLFGYVCIDLMEFKEEEPVATLSEMITSYVMKQSCFSHVIYYNYNKIK